MSFCDPHIMWLRATQRVGHSCVDVDSDAQTSPPLQWLSFLVVQFWEPSHLWDNTHQVVWIWAISCLISYLEMPTAHDQETLDQWDIVAPHAGRRETLVPLEDEFKCSLPVGVWREAPLFFQHPKGFLHWPPRMGSQVIFRPLSVPSTAFLHVGHLSRHIPITLLSVILTFPWLVFPANI